MHHHHPERDHFLQRQANLRSVDWVPGFEQLTIEVLCRRYGKCWLGTGRRDIDCHLLV